MLMDVSRPIDFLNIAQKLIKQAENQGAIFNTDGTYHMKTGFPLFSAAFASQLKVHRNAISILIKNHD